MLRLRNPQILKKTLEKSSQFCHQSSPMSRKPWTLPWKLWEFKNTSKKLAVGINTRVYSIQILTERSANDGGNLCPLWLVILKSVWSSVGDILLLRYSWPWAVVNYTLLLCLETDWNVRVGKRGYKAFLFISTDFKKWCLDVSFLTPICINILKWNWEKLNFLKIN